MKENLLKIGDTMAVPHHCDICDKDFLNYIDDVDFEKNEDLWFIDIKNGKKVEFCVNCKKREMKSKGE